MIAITDDLVCFNSINYLEYIVSANTFHGIIVLLLISIDGSLRKVINFHLPPNK